MKKLIYFSPLLVFGYGCFWTTVIFPESWGVLSILVGGLLFLIVSMIPAFLISGGIKGFSKKKEEGEKKSSYWYFVWLYTFITAIVLFGAAAYTHSNA